jgi:hypothetical protein
VCAWPAAGQVREPVGPFVVDARGLMSALPATAGWTPTLPTGTEVPSRGFGFETGGHLYLAQWGPAAIGLGGAFTFARGTATPADGDTPGVIGRVSTVAPQLSLNFGHRLGWSYLSAGYGAAHVESESLSIAGVPASLVASGWVSAVNIGGGARWFLREHLGVGFDVRWHRLRSREATAARAAAARTTLFQLAVGLSIQ